MDRESGHEAENIEMVHQADAVHMHAHANANQEEPHASSPHEHDVLIDVPDIATSLYDDTPSAVVAKDTKAVSPSGLFGVRPHQRDHDSSAEDLAETKQGTIKGVYIPCLQNILGVLLFLRLPWITGQAGIGLTLAIIFLSVSASFLTTLSLSAISSNGKIKGGGSYYLVSRNLGPAFGAAVGVCFYLGTAAGCAMYILGAVEAFLSTFPGAIVAPGFNGQVLGIILLGILFAVVFVGMESVGKVGSSFLVVVIVGVVCVVVGLLSLGTSISSYTLPDSVASGNSPGFKGSTFSTNWGANMDAGVTFASLLALFFPSATGIMAGSNRSAVLATPQVSIPRGTLAAVGTTTLLYIVWVFFFASALPRQVLKDDLFIVPKVSLPLPEIVQAAIILSSTGAGLQTLAGSPQLLLAISQDLYRDIPLFSHMLVFEGPEKRVPSSDARKAVVVTTCFVLLLVLYGDLDAVAPIATMFLLMCYCATNVACLLVTVLKRPSWRPTWKYYHWGTSLLGALLCVAIMFATGWLFAIAALLLAGFIHQYVTFKRVERDWGDGLQGMKYARAVHNLLDLSASQRASMNNWRPQFLLLYRLNRVGADDEGDLRMFQLLSYFRKAQGLMHIIGVLDNVHSELPRVTIQEVKDSELFGADDSDDDGSSDTSFDDEKVASREESLVRAREVQPVPEPSQLSLYKQRDYVQQQREHMQSITEPALRKLKLPATFKVVGATHQAIADTVPLLLQCTGVGALEPNTILLRWPHKWDTNPRDREFFLSTVHESQHFSKALVVCMDLKTFPDLSALLTSPASRPRVSKARPLGGTIDIWWERADGGMMLLLAQLLTKHSLWRKCRLRLFTVAFELENSLGIKRRLEQYLRGVRIPASVHVVEFESVSDNNLTSDAYVVQRTLDMEQRHLLLLKMRMQQRAAAEDSEDLTKGRHIHDSGATLGSNTAGVADLSELARSLSRIRELKRQKKNSGQVDRGSRDEKTVDTAHGASLLNIADSGAQGNSSSVRASSPLQAMFKPSVPGAASKSASSLADLFAGVTDDTATDVAAEADAGADMEMDAGADAVRTDAGAASTDESADAGAGAGAGGAGTGVGAADSQVAPQATDESVRGSELAKRVVVKDRAVDALTYGGAVMVAAVVRFPRDVKVGDPLLVVTLGDELIAEAQADMTSAEFDDAEHGVVARCTKLIRGTSSHMAAIRRQKPRTAQKVMMSPLPEDSKKRKEEEEEEQERPAVQETKREASEVEDVRDETAKRTAKMMTAVRYNDLMRTHSKDASVIITNLPKLSAHSPLDHDNELFLSFTEILTENLPRVLLVRGTQTEVVTSFL